MKVCFAFARVSPLFNAFFSPPEISCALERGAATILRCLHLPSDGRFCVACIPFRLRDQPCISFCLVPHALVLHAEGLRFA